MSEKKEEIASRIRVYCKKCKHSAPEMDETSARAVLLVLDASYCRQGQCGLKEQVDAEGKGHDVEYIAKLVFFAHHKPECDGEMVVETIVDLSKGYGKELIDKALARKGF